MPQFLLFIAILAVATSAPLVREAAPAPALAVAALRVITAGVIFGVAAGPKLTQFFSLGARQKRLALLSSLFLATHFAVWISSLYFTSVAASTALVAMQPVFAALFGFLFLREPVQRREWIGIAIAAIGCAVLAGGDFGSDGRALFGDGLALAGAMSAAAYFTLGRGLRDALPLVVYLAVVHLAAGALLLCLALFSGVPLLGLPTHSYLAIFACAVVPSAIGHALLNYSVRRVKVHLVALGILGEPVGASLLAWLLYSEVPTRHAWVGGVVILFGIAAGFACGSKVPQERVLPRENP